MADMYTSMTTSSSSQTEHPTHPLPRLKSTGFLAGGLMAVGGALLLPSLLLFFSLLRDKIRYILHEPDPNEGMWVGPDWARLFEPWVLLPFLFGVLFVITGWLVNYLRLRDSELTTVHKLAAIATPVMVIVGCVADLAVFAIADFLFLETRMVLPAEMLILSAITVAFLVGGLTGRFIWSWLGKRQFNKSATEG